MYMIHSTSTWTRYEDKLFEEALVMYPEGVVNRWKKIAIHVPGKSPEDIMAHYDALVYDVFVIDSGRVDIPSYNHRSSEWEPESGTRTRTSHNISFESNYKNHTEQMRKKGTPWTPEEHRLFLIGLERYGKGDWRSISRNVVVTRTPMQVASHAQKYFKRQESMKKKERKRSSIHDITVDTNILLPQNNNQNQGVYQNYNFPL